MLNATVKINRLVFRRNRFSLRDWWAVLVAVVQGVGEKQLSLMAAGVAFFAMLALFPAITATISLFGYVADPLMVQENMALMEPIMPYEVYYLIRQQVISLVTAEPATLGIASVVSLLVAIWSARAGITAMMAGLNLIGHDVDNRNILWSLVVAYSLTLLLILVTLIAIGTVVVVPTILAFFPLGGLSSTIVDWSRWAIAILAVGIAIGTLYRFGPARRFRRSPMLTLGSIVATLLWVVVSVLFSLYMGNFANYNEIYGSLGAVIALLMWFYLSAFVVLLGAELNAEIEQYAIKVIRRRNPTLLGGGDTEIAEPQGDA